MSAPELKEIPVFSSDSIRAMSPIGREIAKLLLDAGYIKVVDQQPTRQA